MGILISIEWFTMIASAIPPTSISFSAPLVLYHGICKNPHVDKNNKDCNSQATKNGLFWYAKYLGIGYNIYFFYTGGSRGMLWFGESRNRRRYTENFREVHRVNKNQSAHHKKAFWTNWESNPGPSQFTTMRMRDYTPKPFAHGGEFLNYDTNSPHRGGSLGGESDRPTCML